MRSKKGNSNTSIISVMKRHIFTVSILLVAAQLFGQESRFWVGGSGKWNDNSHWSVTSGGEPGAAVPESGTSVVFDENSFSGGRNTVTLNSAVSIGSLTATDADFVFSGKQDFTVGGSINTDANADFGKLRGTLVLSGSGDHTFSVASELEGGIIIDGGSWTLGSNLKTEGDITLKSGSFNTAGHNVTCAVFLATEDAESLNIEKSTILCDRWNTVAAEFMTVKADDSEILIRKNMIDNVFVGDRQDYNSIHRNSASKGHVVVATIVEHPLCPSNSDYGTKDNGKVYVEINGGVGTYNILAIRQGADMASKKEPNANSIVLEKLTAGKWKIGYVNKYTDSDFQGETEVTIGPGIFVGGARGEGIEVTGKARCWGDDIVLSCNATGGTLPYTLSWENPRANTAEGFEKTSSADLFPVQLGAAVGLTITDAIGCQIVANGQKPWYYSVDEEDDYKYNGDYKGPELIRATYDIEPTCEDESTGVLTINATGGSGSYTEYVVEGKAPQGTPTFNELAAGTYEVTITDSKGCTNYDYRADFNKLTATMTDIPKPTATVDAEESIVCFEDGEYTITDAHAGTTKNSVVPESILWSVKSGTAASIKSGGNTASPTLTLNAPGDVTFTMTVGNGSCIKATVDKTIHVIPVPVPTLVTANNSKICGLSTTIEANKDPLIDGDYSLVAEFVSSDDGTALPPNGLNVTVTNPGTYIFKVKEIVTTAHCVGYSSELTIKFYNSPTVSLDKSSSSICGIDENVPLKAIIANGDVKWTTADGSGTFGDENSAETYYTPVAADLGKTITLTATVDNDGCDPVSADYTLTVNEVPNPDAPSVPAEVCGKSIGGTTDHSLPGSTLTWKSEEGSVKFVPTTGESTTMSVTTEGTYHIYIEESLNGCPKASTSTEVNFRPEPTLTITQGTAGSVCGNESFDLSATTNCNADNIIWDKGTGAGTLSSSTGASTKYTPVEADYGKTITITATVSSDYAICSTPVTKDFALTVKTIAKPEIAHIGNAEGKVCGTTVSATATPKMGGDLTWDWGGDPTLTVSPSTGENVTISGDNGVSYSVRVTETADGCSATSDDVFFTLYDQPAVSIADASGDVCGTDEFTATANAENATSLVWTVESGSGTPTVTVIEANKQVKVSYTPNASDIDQDVTLKATASNGGVCTDAEETVTFHVYKVPSPSISDLSICGSTDVLTATITAGNTVEWVVPSVVSKSNEEINGTTASVTLTLNEGAEYTNYTVGIIESNANCSSPQVDATVTFVHEPVITVPDLAPQVCAGEEFLVEPDFDYCTSISITASDMGNFAPILGEYKAKYKAPESTNPTSPVSIWITPSGGCNSEVVTITLTVNPKPQPNLSDVVVCGLSYEVPENTARSVENSLLTWVPATGQSNVHIEGGKYFVSTEEGDKYLTVTESAGMCQTEKTAKITFVAKPEANAGDDDAVCYNEASYELTAATAEHCSGVEWTVNDGTDVWSTDLNPTYSFTAADKTNGSVKLTLRAKANTPCGSEDDAISSITITINPLPEPTVTGPATACPNDTDPAVYTTESGMDGYKWYIDGVLQDGETSSTFSHQWTVAGTYTVSVGYTDGNGCEGVSDDFTVTVNTLPVSGLAANAESCTNGSVGLDATVTSGGSGDFSYAWSGTGVNYLDDPNVANPTFASDVADTYALTCTITDNQFGCSIEAKVTVDNKQGPSVSAGEDKMVCYGMSVQMVDADTSFCTSVKWTSNGDGSFDDDEKIDAIYTPGENDKLNANNLNGYTITLTLTAFSATCGDITDDVEITLQPQLQVAVGTVKPFDIQASTKISVKVQGEFDLDFGGAEGLQFFLLSPDREDTVALFAHGMATENWARWPGTFDFEFTTESDVTPTYKGFPKYGEAKAQFGITGDWSDIYGKNPAEGGWTVMLGGKYTSYGVLKRATIVFGDYEDNDPTKAYKTIKFDSKEKNPGIEIPDGQYLSYISPIGLNVSCRNLCDAHAIAKGIGGAGVYTSFEWSTTPGFEEENIIGSGEKKDLCVGTYYVRVTDAAGCTAIIEVEVGAPDDIHIVDNNILDATCNGASDGIIDVSAYKENVTQFQFVIDGFQADDSGKDWAIFNTLPEGTYDLIVIDEDYCSDTITYNIGQPDKLEITKIDTVLATSCIVDNGSVTFTVIGGKVADNYHIEYMGLPQDQPNIAINQATLTATNLAGASGIRFRIYDAATFNPLDLEAGCFIDTTVSTVAEGMELDIAVTENSCNGADEASITVSVSKGSGDYNFEWYDENGLIATTIEPTMTGLTAGTYTVKVNDLNTLCDATSNPIVLTDPLPIVITKNIIAIPKCFGEETASFSITADGGLGNLTYAWQKDGVSIDNATNSFENVGAGEYTVIVSDGFCEAKDTIKVVEPTSKLSIINDTVITTPSDCGVPTGSATIAVEGGSGGYSYYWHLALGTDSVADDAAMAANLGVGRYIVEVSDMLGCTVTKEFRVQDDGNVDFAWNITNELLCVGNTNGEAEVTTVSGRDENGRVVTVYDVNLISWENLATGQTGTGNKITNLGYGTNEIMVIASDGCSSVKNIEIDESNSNVLRVDNPISYPDQFGNGNCDGTIKATITGGVPGYSYIWTNEAGETIDAGTSDSEVTTTLTSLCEGEYTLYVEDQNPEGTCTLIETIKVEFSPLSYSVVLQKNVTCFGGDNGELKITGVDGYPSEEYQYEWTSSQWPADKVVKGDSIGGLTAGWYTFVVSQRNNRRKVIDSLEITQPTNRLHIPTTNTVFVDGSHCYDSIGAIQIYEPANLAEAFGGNTPFTYKFSHEGWATDSVKGPGEEPWITKLPIGDYNLHLTDALGCTFDTVIEVPDLSKFVIKVEKRKDPRCYGDNNGEIKIVASSENGGFTYSWNTGATTDEITKLAEGTYTVKVTDNMNCEKFETIELTQPLKVSFSVSSTVVDCYNMADGGKIFVSDLQGGWNKFNRFEFFAQNSVKPLIDSTFAPEIDTTFVSFSNLLPAGDYKLCVTDVNNCPSDSVPFKVYSARPEIAISNIVDDEPNCYNYTTDGKLSYGKITVTAIAMVTSQVSSTVTDLEQYYQIDGGAAQKAHIFDKVTAGPHTITVGFGADLDCPVVVDHELGSKNDLRADAAFKDGQNVVFTCPDNELSAYVKSVNGTRFSSYKFYALYDEDAENYGQTVEPQPAPAADTATTADTVAYRFSRGIYYRADSLSEVDTTGTTTVDTTNVTPEPVQKPVYNYGTDIRGNKVVLFASGNGSDTEAWADNFLPYGGATYYYFEIADNQCVAIDSIKATSLRPTEKLTAIVSMDDATSDELFVAGEYEVPEGGLLKLEANQLQFAFDNTFVYSENAWSWDWAPADKLNGEGSGLRYESTNNDNPIEAMSFGKLIAKVRDSVAFELSDLVYNIDTAMVCYYYDSVKINSISGIHPADVFTPNGDEYNETWRIEGLAAYDKVTIYVFNRWGGRVWQYSGSGKEYSDAHQWNGRNEKNKPVPSGTYYYVIQCSDGILGGKKVTGPVTVIR